ncbi:MAG TPA: type III pantothenate kinase [Pirellulales bacterium]|nr:type III pantothenate kinase [Pirellulales bacterium]
MTSSIRFPLVAVDIGNSRIKLGLFASPPDAAAAGLPAPSQTLALEPEPERFHEIAAWLGPAMPPHTVTWWIGSVQRNVTVRLVDWLRQADVSQMMLLSASDLPLAVRLPRPDMVGVDRLLGAVAANRLRTDGQGAIVVDLGTAITVDLVSSNGEFLGGAILPGIGISARALNQFTDLLPLVKMHELAEPPPALGSNTIEAMCSGLYWGAVGGVKQLIELLGGSITGEPAIFLTGGAAPAVAGLLSQSARYEPHLTLAGIALAAAQ